MQQICKAANCQKNFMSHSHHFTFTDMNSCICKLSCKVSNKEFNNKGNINWLGGVKPPPHLHRIVRANRAKGSYVVIGAPKKVCLT